MLKKTSALMIRIIRYNRYGNKTSREIEARMMMEKYKSIKLDLKSIKTSFGINRPSIISNSYPKPPTYQYTLQSLRYVSHVYPEYLLTQLTNPNSQFHKVIDQMLESLWKAQPQEVLQILQFIHCWKIDDRNLTKRLLSQLNLNMNDLFSILKWCQYNEVIENILISRLSIMDKNQYQPLFKIINFLRIKDISSPSFFISLERKLLQNINQIPPSSLAILALHYAHNINQNHDYKINILHAIRSRLASILKFLTHQELIAVIYSYLRTDLLSTQLLSAIVIRIQLIYDELSIPNKLKIFPILPTLPQLQRMRIIAAMQLQFIKTKTIHYSLLSDLLLASFQANMLTQETSNNLNQLIIQNILNMEPKEVTKAIWVFYRTANDKTCNSLSKKIQIIIEGGLKDYQVKDISLMVWALSLHSYQPNAPFWQNIQSFIQEQLAKQQSATLTNCGYIAWSYLNNRPLTSKTISTMTNILLTNHPTILPFTLVNLVSFYYSIDSQQIEKVKPILILQFQRLNSQMTSTELLKCFRYVSQDISKHTFQQIINIINHTLQTITYQQALCWLGMLIGSKQQCLGKDKMIVQLGNKIKELQSLTHQQL